MVTIHNMVGAFLSEHHGSQVCVLEGVPDSTKGLFVVLRDYESRLFQWAHCVQSATVWSYLCVCND